MFKVKYFSILLMSFLVAEVEAKDLCDVYRNYTPLPDWYNSMCNGTGGFRAKAGGSFSSFADAFNLNPANLPTLKTPLGVEYISNVPIESGRVTRGNFGLIKGFSQIGAGISTNADDTFFGNSAIQSAKGTGGEAGLDALLESPALPPSINLGTALALLAENHPAYFKPNIGALLSYNKLTGNWRPGFGFSANSPNFTAGFSRVVETQKSSSTATPSSSGSLSSSAFESSDYYYNLTLGFKLRWLQAEYIYLTQESTTSYGTYSGGATQIAMLSISNSGWMLVAAMRQQSGTTSKKNSYYHGSLQYQLSHWFGAGYHYNYLIGYHSLSAQFLF